MEIKKLRKKRSKINFKKNNEATNREVKQFKQLIALYWG
jgi:hypothetical protein